MKDKMLEFMNGHLLCTMATVTPNALPEAAYVGFTFNEKMEIFVGTLNWSRKYHNIKQNNSVAIVIADTKGEVQYEGKAEEITDADYRQRIEENHMKKIPGAAKYRENPEQVYFKITPTWARFISHGDPDEMEEFTEF